MTETTTAGQAQQTPEWVTETPAMEYRLKALCFEANDAEQQNIEITLKEYEACKRLVAKMRGLKVDAAEEAEEDEREEAQDDAPGEAGEFEQQKARCIDRLELFINEEQHKWRPNRLALVGSAIELLEGVGPFECFVRDLLSQYSLGWRAMTPDAVAEDLEEFRENWECAVETARRIMKHYPDQFAAATSGAGEHA